MIIFRFIWKSAVLLQTLDLKDQTQGKKMQKLLIILSVIAVTSGSVINFDEFCDGIVYSALAHPMDPNLFIGCVQGKGSVFSCGDGEVFNQLLVNCDKEVTDSSNEDLCENILFGLRPFGESSSQYVSCELTRAHIRTCPDESVFDPESLSCVISFDDDDRRRSTTTRGPITIPTIPSIPTIPPIPTPPTRTTTSRTTMTLPTFRTTTPNDDLTTTHHQEQTTTSQSTTEPPLTTRTPDEVNISFVCPEEGYGNVPYKTSCNRFYECSQGVLYPRVCPDGLIFDVIRSECGDPDTSLCAINIRCS